MPISSLKIDTVWKKAALVIAGAALIAAAWFSTRWGMANSGIGRVDDLEMATYLITLAPDDPQTHYVTAVLLEKSFNPGDIEKALEEFEKATALAPNNYLYWLDLGRARERNGDAEGGEKALRHALELAPNYSRVQWALGNALLRQGRTVEAFAEIRKAVVGDPTYAGPAAATAWQFFDGSLADIRKAFPSSSKFDAALAALLVRENRFDEALELWQGLPADEKPTTFKEAGTAILTRLLETRNFRHALGVWSDLNGVGNSSPGQILNGGFESAVKPDGAGPFEWQVSPGLQPQIVLTNGQKHGGNNSLLFVFNAGDAKDFRPVSQTVAVEPGASYDLEIFYRSDLKTTALFKWEVTDAEGRQIALTPAIENRADWSPLRIRFPAPAQGDGIVVRLVREGCTQVCAVTGSLWFDDISLRRSGV